MKGLRVRPRQRRSFLIPGLLVALVAIGAAAWLAQSQRSRAPGEAVDPDARSEAERPPSHARLTSGDATSGGTVVSLTADARARVGIATARIAPKPHRTEIQAYGSVLDLARVTDLTNAYANAKAQLQTAQAKAEVSKAASIRARNLGQYATQVQVETSEGTYQTDQAGLAAAESQVRTLAATAQQEWGPVLGRAIVERSPLATRLIERTDFLVQVTLPPGETLKGKPDAAYAEVPPQSERVSLRYVSPATRTDQRIQGVSFFYTVPGDSGLLPGMSALAFLTSDRSANGVAIPESAVVHWQGRAWFYRGVGENAFARHLLKTDAPMADDAYVVDDLTEPTDIVVTGPQAVLSEELRSQTQATGALDDD